MKIQVKEWLALTRHERVKRIMIHILKGGESNETR